MKLLGPKDIQGLLPKRSQSSNKYMNGYLTVVAGSKRFPGAPRLASHAAARIGAGGVIALVPESISHTIPAFYPEIIIWELKQHGGVLTHATAFEQFEIAQKKSMAILIGCGLDREDETLMFVKNCLSHTSHPVVIDGDALYGLGEFGEEYLISNSQGRWILTPHFGELSHLLTRFNYDPLQADLQEIAKKWQCTVLFKGFPTLAYLPDGTVYENTTGNPSVTTAGCGDVLAGIIAGLLAQGLTPSDAACVGIYIAGKAADKYAQNIKSHSLLATDIINLLPEVLGESLSLINL